MVKPAALPRDLKPRAVSAVVLGVLALAATWAGNLPFALMVLVVGLVMSWEWSRIVRNAGLDAVLLLQLAVVAAAVVLSVQGLAHWALGVVAGGTALATVVGPRPRALMSALGVAYVGLPVVALIWLRGTDSWGALAVLFVFAIVWTTDTFAYFCGRAIGGPKLWPAVSPGKTWSGTLGGIAFAALAGALFAATVTRSAPLALAGAAVLLSIVAQIGDLAESALKRAYAVKNASELIPGHGGFMDRMDGIVTAAAVAALLAVVRGAPSPAQALLVWS